MVRLTGLDQREAAAAIGQAIGIIDQTWKIPDAGYEFAEFAEKCCGVIKTIESSGLVIDAQQKALDNMEEGVSGWLRRQQ